MDIYCGERGHVYRLSRAKALLTIQRDCGVSEEGAAVLLAHATTHTPLKLARCQLWPATRATRS